MHSSLPAALFIDMRAAPLKQFFALLLRFYRSLSFPNSIPPRLPPSQRPGQYRILRSYPGLCGGILRPGGQSVIVRPSPARLHAEVRWVSMVFRSAL